VPSVLSADSLIDWLVGNPFFFMHSIHNIQTHNAMTQQGGWKRRHLATCRKGAHRCYNDNCVRKSNRTYKTTTGRKCRTGFHKCRDNRCHKLRIVPSRRH
jgi:hypothetical protein